MSISVNVHHYIPYLPMRRMRALEREREREIQDKEPLLKASKDDHHS